MKITALLFTVFAAYAAASPSRGLKFGAPPPDVDECLIDNGGCSHCCTNYDYLVFDMSFECTCPEGWTMTEDGMTCSQDLACPTYGCSNMCTETVGLVECIPAPDPVCSCPGCAAGMGEGFVLDSDMKTCVDVDECSVGNGGCSDMCINTPGCYECECPGCADGMGDGFVLGADGKTCLDIDECAVGNGGCSDECINTPGCFECACPGCAAGLGDGFVLSGDMVTCVDVDECAVGNGGCSDECINTPGCYECACPGCADGMGVGFVLSGDAKTCVDVDECAVGNGGCSDICINTPGCYECACPGCASGMGDGFVLAADGTTCVDIDECAVNNGGCSDICVNTPGCYTCTCPPACDDPELPIPAGGYTLTDSFTCSDVDECSATGWEGACAGLCENEPGCYACISADVTTDYKMSLTLIMHDYLVSYMDETIFSQMVADTIGVETQYIQIDAVEQVGPDTEVSFTWFAIDATSFVTLLLAVEQIDWVPILIDYMQVTLPAGAF